MTQKELKEAFFKEHPNIYAAFKKNKVLSAIKKMHFYKCENSELTTHTWEWKGVPDKKFMYLERKIITDINSIYKEI